MALASDNAVDVCFVFYLDKFLIFSSCPLLFAVTFSLEFFLVSVHVQTFLRFHMNI
jgi:hypothetical protein